MATAVAGASVGLAMELLHGDRFGWFAARDLEVAVAEAMTATLDDLARRLGPDMATWRYGRLHILRLRHCLTARGDLGQLLDRSGPETGGSMVTVCNTHFGPDYESNGGATCRFFADLSASPPAFWNVLPQGQSGHPGSPHYCDQSAAWIHRGYHRISFDGPDADEGTVERLVLEPG